MNVIEVGNLSKRYDLGLVGTGTLSKDLNRFWAKARGKDDPYATIAEINDRTQKSNSNTVYALKDISFNVKQGEVLGIIGKNGAGKSTLLKILSQITTPTVGEIRIKGRVASLLEVGTGMHPEMTARQNIYLNGAILGMRRWEITKKLDEIVEFAGIGKYIDTPTKRFSSGMQVRLGFAVAAFLEPEILIVDEVLAVGDAEFQKRAIGKMKEVSKGEGRTVLFVSHNMASVNNLCSKCIVLDQGGVSFTGTAEKAIENYLSSSHQKSSIKHFSNRINKHPEKPFLFTRLKLKDDSNNDLSTTIVGQNISIQISYRTLKQIKIRGVRILVIDSSGTTRLVLNGAFVNDDFPLKVESVESGTFVFDIPKLPLPPGSYHINVSCFGITQTLDEIENALTIDVEGGDFYGFGKLPNVKEGVYIPYKFTHS